MKLFFLENVWKCHLKNGSHFVGAAMGWSIPADCVDEVLKFHLDLLSFFLSFLVESLHVSQHQRLLLHLKQWELPAVWVWMSTHFYTAFKYKLFGRQCREISEYHNIRKYWCGWIQQQIFKCKYQQRSKISCSAYLFTEMIWGFIR